MDKYEYKVRSNEIEQLIAQGEYAEAAEIADTIDWRRVKSVMMLCKISDLYKINRRYEDARDMLLLAYDRRPGGRTICYSLCELSIKMEEYVQAIEYYKEYVQATSSPMDTGRYILQYKLYEAQDVSLEERIAVLEKLKQCDYLPKWGYELAYLYHRVGLASRCVEECDEFIAWFGDGKYVIKTMELKMLHQPLSPEQQQKYDHRFDDLNAVSQISPEETYQETAYVAGTENGQKGDDFQKSEILSETQDYASVHSEQELWQSEQQGSSESQMDTSVKAQEDASQKDEALDIHVKTMDVGQYNTINLQAELAEGLREVLAGDHLGTNIDNPVTRSIIAPMLQTDTEVLDDSDEEEKTDDAKIPTEEIEESEVFFGETGEISDLQGALVSDATAEIVMEQLRQENASKEEEVSADEVVFEEPEKDTPKAVYPKVAEVIHAEPPKALANVLSQESDGQLSLVMPERESIEKQITGQISMEDILAEWERMKKENQEKREEEVRQHVLQQTGSMFTEFESAVRDGLLEQLERGKHIEGLADAEEEEAPDVIEDTDEVEELEEMQEGAADEQIAGEEFDEEPEQTEEFEPAEESEMEEEFESAEEFEMEEEPESAEEFEMEEELAGEEFDEEPEQTEEFELAEESEVEEELESAEAFEWNEEAETEEKPEIDEMPSVVERDREKVRALTREEKELFAPFIQSRASREQLVKAIDSISLAAFTGNVIITGEEGMDTLSLAKNMIREVQSTDSNFSGKVAKISGKALNKKDVAATLEQLKNGALIIAKASEMSDDTAKALYKALQQESMGIIVVMEDSKKTVDKFLSAHEELRACFNARMDIEALSNDMLVAFGRQYARELEYSIDDFGILALHTRIEDMQTIDHVVTVMEVKAIVDDAIRHANRKTLGHFLDILFAKRYDEEDMIRLSEKDFV